jgi:hypothetical protein
LVDTKTDCLTEEALLRHKRIAAMSEPKDNMLADLQDFLASDEMGSQIFDGSDALIWGTKLERDDRAVDLVTLLPSRKQDSFSEVFSDMIMKTFFAYRGHRFRKPHKVNGMIFYKKNAILRITLWITSVLASLLPIASIVVLYRVASTPARLGIIAMFNLLVSMSLATFTTASRSEIFAVTTAYVSSLTNKIIC